MKPTNSARENLKQNQDSAILKNSFSNFQKNFMKPLPYCKSKFCPILLFFSQTKAYLFLLNLPTVHVTQPWMAVWKD
jgi:hypothetical protein